MTVRCRIVRLACMQGRNTTRLTAACGWEDLIRQGVEWERCPGRARWLGHDCLTEEER